MDFTSFAKIFLSGVLIENFDVVKGEVNDLEQRIDRWLDQKKEAPTDYYASDQVIAYGFTLESVVQDFPVRGMSVYLHIRRRKWQVIHSGKIFSQPFDITYNGTRLTKELVAFLKDTNRE